MFSKTKTYLGIDIGAGGVKAVELELKKKRPVLSTYAIVSEKMPVHHEGRNINTTDRVLKIHPPEQREQISKKSQEDFDEGKLDFYRAVLKSVRKQAKIKSTTATVSLPVSAVFHAVVNLPKIDKKDFDSILNAEVKKLSPLPLEELSLDYQVISKNDDGVQQVLVNAVEKKRVNFYAKMFQGTGIVVEALEPESTALSRVLIGKDQSVSMIVDIGSERTNFFIVENAVPMTHHSIEMGGDRVNKILASRLGVGEEMIDQIKMDLFGSIFHNNTLVDEGKMLDLFSVAVEPIIKEIDYSFEVYLKQQLNQNKVPDKIVLTGGGAFMPYLAKQIENKFNKRCFVADPWAKLVYQEKLRPLLNKIGPRMSVSVGLALRNMI